MSPEDQLRTQQEALHPELARRLLPVIAPVMESSSDAAGSEAATEGAQEPQPSGAKPKTPRSSKTKKKSEHLSNVILSLWRRHD